MDTQRAILTQLLQRPMSLAGLSSATGVSLPTLRRAVSDLLADRWIALVGREAGTGGRPANLFGVDAAAHAVVGVQLEHPGMRLVATDLNGTILDERTPEGVDDLELDTVLSVVLGYLEHLRDRFPDRHALGLALASPGFIEPATGTVIAIGRVPTWNNLPIAQRLRVAAGLPVTIGNDVDAMATAEFGVRVDARAVAYVAVGEGVKFSMFLHGQPYVGPFGNAGLVSLGLVAGASGAERAQLLTVGGLSDAYLRRAAGDDRALAGAAELRAQPSRRTRYRSVLALADAGDALALALVDEMVAALGAQLASFVHLIQPEVLVIGGALAGASDRVVAEIEAAVRPLLPPLLDNNLFIRRARFDGRNAAAIGATRVFVHRFLQEEGPLVVGVPA